jgi:multiple sugar transport system permease protein
VAELSTGPRSSCPRWFRRSAAAVAFLFLLHAGGPIDHILGFLHLPQPLWFLSAQWSKPGLVVIGHVGDRQHDDHLPRGVVGRTDPSVRGGRHRRRQCWQKLRHITLPMISPVIFFTAVIGVIYGFQYFTEAYVVGASIGGAAGSSSSSLGSPQGSTLFYTIWLYQQGSRRSTWGTPRRWRGSCSRS